MVESHMNNENLQEDDHDIELQEEEVPVEVKEAEILVTAQELAEAQPELCFFRGFGQNRMGISVYRSCTDNDTRSVFSRGSTLSFLNQRGRVTVISRISRERPTGRRSEIDFGEPTSFDCYCIRIWPCRN